MHQRGGKLGTRRLAATIGVWLWATVSGCSGGTPTGPEGITLDDLAGTWNATEFVYGQQALGPAVPDFDLIAEGGSATLVIQSNGRFTLTTVDPGGVRESRSGTLAFDFEEEDFLLVVFDDEPEDELEFFFIVLNDNSFRLSDTTGEGELDLDGDGVEEQVRINSTWVR